MGEPITDADEVTAVEPMATVELAVWVWEVVVSVLRQKDEYGHIAATADAIEWQLARQDTGSRVVPAAEHDATFLLTLGEAGLLASAAQYGLTDEEYGPELCERIEAAIDRLRGQMGAALAPEPANGR